MDFSKWIKVYDLYQYNKLVKIFLNNGLSMDNVVYYEEKDFPIYVWFNTDDLTIRIVHNNLGLETCTISYGDFIKQKPKFKVGDRVKIDWEKSRYNGEGMKLEGKVLYRCEETASKNVKVVRCHCDNHNNSTVELRFLEEQLTLVESKPKCKFKELENVEITVELSEDDIDYNFTKEEYELWFGVPFDHTKCTTSNAKMLERYKSIMGSTWFNIEIKELEEKLVQNRLLQKPEIKISKQKQIKLNINKPII